ncbi:MAG: hypothetical protein R2941_07970 [Desulfobacterales bacterium]
MKALNLNMTDSELERTSGLWSVRILMNGQTNFDYRGVGDNIFDKVFKGFYQKEIEGLIPKKSPMNTKLCLKNCWLTIAGFPGSKLYKGMFAEFRSSDI